MSTFSIKSGVEYLCTTTIVDGNMDRDESGEIIRRIYYKAGKIYKSEWYGCITDERNDIQHMITSDFGKKYFIEINEFNKFILQDSSLFSTLFENSNND